MAFPAFTGSIAKSTTGAVNTLTLVCTMPASIAAGEGLLCITSWDNTGTLSTASAGWAKLGQQNNSGATLQHAAFWKIAVGGDTLTIDTSVSDRGSALIMRVTGCDKNVNPSWVGADNGTGTTANSADPPNLAPGYATDFLWVAGLAMDGVVTATVAPTNYTGFDGQVGSANGAGTYWGSRSLNGSSEDPGVFTHGVATQAVSTIAIPPIRSLIHQPYSVLTSR